MKKLISILPCLCCLVVAAQPGIVAHRGCRNEDASRYENTIASLRYAQELGVDAVEFDLQLTSDNKIIVFHGPLLPNTKTNIQDISFEQARAFVLPGGHSMPTLEEWFIQAGKHPEVKLILEFKGQRTKERETMMVEQAMDLAKRMNMAGQLEYTTFSWWALSEVHRIDSSAKVLFLSSGVNVPDATAAKSKGADAISYDLSALMNNTQIINQAKSLGMGTTLWIANDGELYDWAMRHGVDYVSTDHPAQMLRYASQYRQTLKGQDAVSAGPSLDMTSGIPTLVSNGKPLVLLGGQVLNSGASTREAAARAFDLAVEMHFNCVWAPVAWEQFEPQEGKFDYKELSFLLDLAKERNLHLVLLWFGSWKNGESSYAPAWVKSDVKRFPRAVDSEGRLMTALSTFGKETLKADGRAFSKMMAFLRNYDKTGVVCAVQIENEVGVFADMDHRKEALNAYNRGFKGKCQDEEMDKQTFMAWAYARYLNQVALSGKKEYDIPMYTNAWLPSSAAKLGQFPNGGPRAVVLDVWKKNAPALDWLSPDIYSKDYSNVMNTFRGGGNPLFIPELNLDAGPAYLAFGEYGSMAFSVFGFEELEGDRRFAGEYGVLGELLDEIAVRRSPDSVHGFYRHESDAQDGKVSFTMGDWCLNVKYIKGEPYSHGIIIKLSEDEFLIAGLGAFLEFQSVREGRVAKVLHAEELYRENGEWKTMFVLNGDETAHNNMLYLRGRLDGVARTKYQNMKKAEWQKKFKVSGIYKVKLYTYPER